MSMTHTIHEMVGNPEGDGTIMFEGPGHLPVGTVCEIHGHTDGSETYNFSIPGSPGHDLGQKCHEGHRYVLEMDDKFHFLPTI